jgi:DNA polymerase
MLALEKAGFEIVMHVHDELVSENDGARFDEFMSIMRSRVSWLPNLPLAAEGWNKTRYGK